MSKYLVVLLLAAVVAGACGARVTEQQIEAAGGGQRVGGTGDLGTGAAGEAPGLATADDVGAGTADGLDPEAGPGADPGAAGGGGGDASDPATPAGGGGGGTAAPAAPAEGNGGATDVGVTANQILLGNVSTLSGPVPGLFQGAVIGTQAVVAYQNSKGGLYGRTFKLEVRDDQFDTGQNRSQTIDLIGKVFAFVGSFSLYDDAAAQQIARSGIPDVSYSLSNGRRAVPNNFSPQPAPPGWRLGPLNYYKKKFPQQIKAVGTLHGDVPSAAATHAAMRKAAESVGWKFVYDRAYAATETDFTADVIRMRQAGVKMLYFTSIDVKNLARFAKAAQQQGFEPEVFASGGVAYDPALLSLAGDAVEGLINDQQYALFAGEDANVIPEVKLFNQWLQRVKPGYKPDLFAAFAWASGRLFFQALEAAGPKATRADVVRALQGINDFSSNGLLAPAAPGKKTPPTCYVIAQVKGGRVARFDSPRSGYRCGDGGYFRV